MFLNFVIFMVEIFGQGSADWVFVVIISTIVV